MPNLAGTFAKGLLGISEAVAKATVSSGVKPSDIAKTIALSAPIIGAMQVMDLSRTGEVVGEYIKNKLVPGLEESNMARDMELQAKLEMGAKRLPEISAAGIAAEQSRARKELLVQEAVQQKDKILADIKQDLLLKDVPIERLSKLVDDVIRIAPSVTMQTPTVVLSVIRDAAMSGMDSIGVNLAAQLTDLENTYAGRM